MYWHIITGSKGGVGKTLLTLLLLEYHLETKPDEGVLILDLNAMNTDTSAMLLHNKRGFSNPILIQEIMLQQTYSCNKDGDSRYFGVGWPTDPFALYGREQFVKLLSVIRNKRQEIKEKLAIQTLNHVIIDTNYHFCNLFPQQDQDYKKYADNGLTEDTINIWFLWVYRQLSKLLFQNKDDESDIMKLTAGTIERVFNNKGIGSIIHTYTPVGLMSTHTNQGSFLSRVLPIGENMARRGQDYTISKLLELEQLKVGSYLEFRKWIQQLQKAYTEVKSKNQHQSEDTHSLFANILDKAIRRVAGDPNDFFLPINIFPLSIYQSSLEGYTDKEREDAVFALRKMTIYRNFSRLLDRKYESLVL